MKLKDLDYVNNNINLDEYIAFRTMVKEYMEHPEWLGDFSREDLVTFLEIGSKIWIYYNKKEPVCSMMSIPASKKDLIKFQIPIDYREVVDYGPMFVNPKYVGKGLQLQMLEELDKYSASMGYKYGLTTIHPDNIYSIRNALKDGFEYKNSIEAKRGPRNVYLKKY